jgi:hypothetical protein
VKVRLGGPARSVIRPTTRPWPTFVGGLLAVLVMGGCASNPAPAAGSGERTVTELAPPPVSEPATAAGPGAAEPTPGPSGPRPDNGAVVVTRGTSGHGELAIENGTDQDALVTLALRGSAVRAVYVRSSSNTDLRGIPDGTYDIFVAQGDGWNRELRRFTEFPAYSKFDDPAPFQTVRETGAIRYTRLSITLQPVSGGSTSTVPVDPDAYPG